MPEALESRVIRSAEAALAEQKYVGALDVLSRMGLVSAVNVDAWRKGRLEFLEEMIQGSAEKISRSVELFLEWARGKGLTAHLVRYVRRTREGEAELRVFSEGDSDAERVFRVLFFSPDLTEAQRAKLVEGLSRPPERVVFEILRDSECAQCKTELERGEFLTLDGKEALCKDCAGLADLEFLPSGDAGLTRRATKYSGETVVVDRFSRARKRYERQGILVEKAALERAEREFRSGAGSRASGSS
jgi:hypothetical protein